VVSRGGRAGSCAHDANPTIWRRWNEAIAVFAADDTVRLAAVPASAVVDLHAAEDAQALRRRYQL
jgi:hypothetical protein